MRVGRTAGCVFGGRRLFDERQTRQPRACKCVARARSGALSTHASLHNCAPRFFVHLRSAPHACFFELHA